MTVVAFIIMPAATHSYTIEALKGQAVTKQLRDTVTEIQNRIGQRMFERTARYTGEPGTEVPDFSTLLSDEDKILLKRRVFALRRNSLPPVVTHNMADDAADPILNQIRRVQLFNRTSDRVKVLFHPEFLNANNPILGLDYEEFVRGCHMGVFPSYYEPWGYTPAECTVMGVPSITTNLSGFGCYMDELIENSQDYGIYIVDRRMKSVEDSVTQLTDQMVSFCQKTRRQRINQRNRTERLSDLLDWKVSFVIVDPSLDLLTYEPLHLRNWASNTPKHVNSLSDGPTQTRSVTRTLTLSRATFVSRVPCRHLAAHASLVV